MTAGTERQKGYKTARFLATARNDSWGFALTYERKKV